MKWSGGILERRDSYCFQLETTGPKLLDWNYESLAGHQRPYILWLIYQAKEQTNGDNANIFCYVGMIHWVIQFHVSSIKNSLKAKSRGYLFWLICCWCFVKSSLFVWPKFRRANQQKTRPPQRFSKETLETVFYTKNTIIFGKRPLDVVNKDSWNLIFAFHFVFFLLLYLLQCVAVALQSHFGEMISATNNSFKKKVSSISTEYDLSLIWLQP